MQDFSYERLRTQEAALEPYILYRKDQAVQAERNVRIRDFEYFKSMYPDRVKALQLVVEEVCDEMEYEGSPIYDEYPDRILMEQMIQKIAQRAEVSDEKPEQAEMTTEEVEPEVIQAMSTEEGKDTGHGRWMRLPRFKRQVRGAHGVRRHRLIHGVRRRRLIHGARRHRLPGHGVRHHRHLPHAAHHLVHGGRRPGPGIIL